jgi:hypothetical protein
VDARTGRVARLFSGLRGAYFGNCRIYRSHLMRLCGSWREAVNEVAVVCDDLSGGYGQLVAGHAFYQLGDMHRLLGNPKPRRLTVGRANAALEPSRASRC